MMNRLDASAQILDSLKSTPEQCDNENQVALGDLKESVARSSNFQKTVEELSVSEIHHFSTIPDFTSQTRSPYPIIVKNPSGTYCIDGWEFIEQASEQNLLAITCEVIHVSTESEIEVAIWKTAVRIIPMGGGCTYAEQVRNTRKLFDLMMAAEEAPVSFTHGGVRRGAGFTDNNEVNIRHVIAERLGKHPKTIGKYLNHGEFLSDNALETLVKAEIGKGFFEAIQHYKRSLITSLKSQRNAHSQIIAAVSEAVISLLHGHRQTEELNIAIGQTEQNDSPPDKPQTQQHEEHAKPPKPRALKPWRGNDSALQERSPTADEIFVEIKSVGSLLIQLAERKDLAIQQRIEILSAHIIALSRSLQQLTHLKNQQNTDEEGGN